MNRWAIVAGLGAAFCVVFWVGLTVIVTLNFGVWGVLGLVLVEALAVVAFMAVHAAVANRG